MSNLFSGLAQASVTGEGVKLPAGTFGIKITKCHIHKSQNQGSKIAGHDLAIIEFDVEQSAHPSAQKGQSFSCSIDMSDPTYGPGNMKGFILGILGVDHNNGPEVAKIDPHLATIADAAFDGRNIFGPQGPGQEGLLVLVNVVEKTAKQGGHTYKRHVFGPVPGMPPQIHEVIGRMQRAPNPVALPPPAPNAYPMQPPQAPPMQAAPMAQHWQGQPMAPQYTPQGQPQQFAPPAQTTQHTPWGVTQSPPVGPPMAPQYAPQHAPQQTPPAPPQPQYPPGYGAPAPAPQGAPMPMSFAPGWPPAPR